MQDQTKQETLPGVQNGVHDRIEEKKSVNAGDHNQDQKAAENYLNIQDAMYDYEMKFKEASHKWSTFTM
jgi:hypothetical protein